MDVRDATLASLRTQVAFVFQETYLFSDTVGANIAYGRPGITRRRDRSRRAIAQAHEFIEAMPNGYNTVLRERGATVAAGSGSGWRSRGRSSPTRAAWSSTMRRQRSIRRPKT